MNQADLSKQTALKFVILLGVLSLFADMASILFLQSISNRGGA
jgi:hypothetical protein